jgi:hypothetical protein
VGAFKVIGLNMTGQGGLRTFDGVFFGFQFFAQLTDFLLKGDIPGLTILEVLAVQAVCGSNQRAAELV